MFRTLTRSTRTIAGTLSAAVAAAALVLLPAPPEAQGAGLLIADGGFGGNLEITEHTVHVTLNNGIAVTQVTQVFQNQEDRQVEALYTFPVPRGASVSNFSMWINGKEMVGEVVEKRRAREIYDSYKQVRRDPGLLEQTDFRTFEMRIFPIAAKAAQKVQITYAQQLEFDHDTATYVYPLASTTRKELASRTAGKFSFTVDAKSEIPIKLMASPSHAKDFLTVDHGETYRQASLEASGQSLQRDVVMTYQASRPRTGVDVITSRQGREDGYFMLTLTAGEELAVNDVGMDYVFVMDISGSMNDDGKLATERKSVEAFIEGLSEKDRFEIVTFNMQLGTAFGQLRAADGQTKAEAKKFISGLQARGGTVLKPAIAGAYKYGEKERALNVVVLSDGLTEQAENRALMELMQQRPENARVFAVGVGNDVNRALLEQVAEKTGGLAAFVSHEDDFARQAAGFRRKLMRPAATDLKLTFDGGKVYDLEPGEMGTLYHGSPMRVYGRYGKPGTAKATLTGKINGEAFSKAFDVTLPAQDDANPQIERMWAWQRVDRLQKNADATGSRDGVIPEIVRLGEGYSIVTEYTSFLVLENDAEYQRWKINRTNALRVERDRAAMEAVQSELARLREASQSIGPMATGTGRKVELADARLPGGAPAAPGNAAPAPVSRGVDLDLPGTGGGSGGGGAGAIDPVTGLAVAGLGLAALGGRLLRRRRGA